MNRLHQRISGITILIITVLSAWLIQTIYIENIRSEIIVSHGRERVDSIESMSISRAAHTATLLLTGEVLITGGCIDASCEVRSASAELYHPESNSFTRIRDMVTPRVSHSATLLPDGKVLIAGGLGPDGIIGTAELYDPESRTFSEIGRMNTPRASQVAVLLQDDRVLLIGGGDGSHNSLASAELYDPSTGLFRHAGRMHERRTAHTATLLPDGRVLVTGGRSERRGHVLATAELFDPVSGKFKATGSISEPRQKHGAAALPNGKVLIIGGSESHLRRGRYTSAELYDPSTGTFSRVSDMQEERFKLRDAVSVLQSGEVLVAGGAKFLEIFNPGSGAFRVVSGNVGTTRMFATATPLTTGDVLIAGGYDGNILPTAQTWLYRP